MTSNTTSFYISRCSLKTEKQVTNRANGDGGTDGRDEEIQTDRQTHRQTDRQTDRQTLTMRESILILSLTFWESILILSQKVITFWDSLLILSQKVRESILILSLTMNICCVVR